MHLKTWKNVRRATNVAKSNNENGKQSLNFAPTRNTLRNRGACSLGSSIKSQCKKCDDDWNRAHIYTQNTLANQTVFLSIRAYTLSIQHFTYSVHSSPVQSVSEHRNTKFAALHSTEISYGLIVVEWARTTTTTHGNVCLWRHDCYKPKSVTETRKIKWKNRLMCAAALVNFCSLTLRHRLATEQATEKNATHNSIRK